VILVGEAAIGKTSLLGAFAADAVASQARVLFGRCYESTQILPFGPWVDAVRAGDVLADEAVLGSLDPAWRAELTRLFPEIAAAGLPPPSDNALGCSRAWPDSSSISPPRNSWSSCSRTCTGRTR
jgi:hypothetical protein